MNGDLRALYQELLLDHSRRPRNERNLPHASAAARGYNPLCGDRISIQLSVEGGTIREIGFEGTGCAISIAAASMMTEALQGKSRAHAEKLFEAFHRLVLGEGPADTDVLGKLTVFAGVAEFPTRVKCASLPWHTLHAALAGGEAKEVTTE